MRKLILIPLILYTAVSLSAQDFQFSQLEINPFLNNPAANGLSGKDQQIYLVYRTENTKEAAFRNMLLAYEHRINNFVIGTKILQSDAGVASIKSNKILLDFSYRKILNEQGDHLSLGFSGGLVQRQFNPGVFEFESQYREGQGFDESLMSGEQFMQTSSMTPSVSAGLLYTKMFNRFEANFGLALNNLNRPKSIFISSSNYPVQYALFGKINLPWKENFHGDIYFIYNQLSSLKEQVAGIVFNYNVSTSSWLHLGFANRFNGSFILQTGISFDQAQVMLSYDFNRMEQTGSQGVFEMSATYNFKKATISNLRDFR